MADLIAVLDKIITILQILDKMGVKFDGVPFSEIFALVKSDLNKGA